MPAEKNLKNRVFSATKKVRDLVNSGFRISKLKSEDNPVPNSLSIFSDSGNTIQLQPNLSVSNSLRLTLTSNLRSNSPNAISNSVVASASATLLADEILVKQKLPIAPQSESLINGFKFSGTVIAVGPQVTRFASGDSVSGFTLSLPEYASSDLIVTSEFTCTIIRSDTLNWTKENQSCVVEDALAWYGLNEVARVRRGASVLVHVGVRGRRIARAVVQLARTRGCRVFCVVADAVMQEDEFFGNSGSGLANFVVARTDAPDEWKRTVNGWIARDVHVGFDVVLNCWEDLRVEFGYDFVNLFGKFIDYVQRNDLKNSTSSTYHAINLPFLVATRPTRLAQILDLVAGPTTITG
ncbi:hypothetical protein HK100_011658 [Physocladia obscura]|uniref:Enoyl reductase (ER) domain-containing protein n=1 Tax=Physocladia obscura TaxID=109957 RepID=A0AAD5XD32_9FUNG|nr:hypothetical protein HK100_011658 [Physocladia obscura]